MNKFLATIICLFFFTATLWGQIQVEIIESGAEVDVSALFSGMNLSDVPAGRLLDRSATLSDLTALNGTESALNIDWPRWKQVWHDLNQSALSASAKLPAMKEIMDEVMAFREADIVPLGLINVSAGGIPANAEEMGLINLQGNQFTRLSTDNFWTKNQIIALTNFGTKSTNNTIRYILPRTLIFSDKPSTSPDEQALSYAVSADNGQSWQAISVDHVFVINHESNDDISLKIRIQSAQKISFAGADVVIYEEAVPDPDITWSNVTASRGWDGEAGVYSSYIFLGDGNTDITKPIVFVEGFDTYWEDPAQRRTWQELYELMARGGMDDSLTSRGYDIVLLKLGYANDYMQRNSLVLEDLLERLTVVTNAVNKIVVAGPSMGGLISRYCLAQMEQEGRSHNVRLYISMDAPHRGGNVPIGDQFFFDFFQGDSETAALALTGMASPAGQQMLIYHYQSLPNENTLRTTFKAELAALGYPAIRNVALADGSGFGHKQTGNSRTNFVEMKPGDKIVEYYHRSFSIDLDGDVWAVPDSLPKTQVFQGLKNVLGPQYRELNVYITGSKPVDNAPGGHRDTQDEIANSSVEYGNILTGFPRHAFIPIMSALDFDQHPYYNLQVDEDNLLFDNFETNPSTLIYDAIHYADDNLAHISSSVDAINFILKQVDFTGGSLDILSINFAAKLDHGRIDLTWTSRNDFASVVVEQKVGGEFRSIASLDPTAVAWQSDVITDDVVVYRLRLILANGEQHFSTTLSVDLPFSEGFSLSKIWPNPFMSESNTAQFQVRVGDDQRVTATVYDLLGRRMVVLFDEIMPSDLVKTALIDAKTWPAGVYFIRVAGETFVKTQRFIVR